MANIIEKLNVSQITRCTEAEGPGRRFAIWVQGCPLRCAECCNPEMLPFDGGKLTDIQEVFQQIESANAEHRLEGVTFIGGEPFAHSRPLAILAEGIQRAGLTVMIFSGYTLIDLQAMTEESVKKLLQHTDLLVDGPYDRNQPDTSRRWIGSRNQQVHFLSDRYTAQDAHWQQPDTLEVRWDGKELMINGFPAKQATSLWKRGSLK